MTFFGRFSKKVFFMKGSTLIYARAGIIACLYIVLALLTFPIASGAVQLRVSEILTLLPLVYAEAIPALFIGCLISNLITGCVIIDVILGSLVTLLSAIMTHLVKKIIKKTALKLVVGGIFPVLLNALLLPLIWLLCYGAGEYVYIAQVGIIFIGQSLAVYLLGAPTYLTIVKLKGKGISFLQ